MGRKLWRNKLIVLICVLIFVCWVMAFATGFWLLVRLVEAPPAPLDLPAHTLVIDRGPFAPATEARLMRRHRIDVLVTKASGGEATAAKLVAARSLGLPVLMLRRPAGRS